MQTFHTPSDNKHYITNAQDSIESIDLDELRSFYADDHFVREALGAHIDSKSETRTICSFTVRQSHCNAQGAIMGGVLYTLGDFTASVADHSEGTVSATVDSSMQFLAPPKGAHIIATATTERSGRTMAFYHISIDDEQGTHIATGSYTYIHRKRSATNHA
ncbi:MAG: PaaI family thioesterase [Eggerthellaceae bacterium]|jgi:acyl-CoA thioesterase|nr:PaaI family thioesterase [Eggerthellaceae bacterium]MCH4221711.1 PaaI family thioesterase [Eggerthellaceae bacterium]